MGVTYFNLFLLSTRRIDFKQLKYFFQTVIAGRLKEYMLPYVLVSLLVNIDYIFVVYEA